MKKRRAPKKKKSVFARHKIGTALTGLFIISLMALSALSMWKGDTSEKYEYQGVKFTKTESGFIAYNGNHLISVTSNPSELANFSINVESPLPLLHLSKVYISYDHLASTNRAIRTLFRNYNFAGLVIDACPKDSDICSNLPLKTCSDVDKDVGVILFLSSNESKSFYENENCLVIEGQNLNKIVEKMVLEDYANGA